LAQSPFPWPEGKRVAVSLSFDDARASQVTTGLDLFEKHRARVTFYVNPGSMTKQIDGWKRAVRLGHEIGNHSTTHPCSGNFPWSRDKALENHTLARLEADFDQASREIERLLGVQATSFAYPCGHKFIGRGEQTRSYVPLIAKRFLTGRGFRDETPNDPAFVDFAQLFGVDSDSMSFEQMRDMVTRAEAIGGWVVFAGHEIGASGNQTTLFSTLDRFLIWAADPANGVWLDRVDTVARHVRQSRPRP
jgi:peptidoglycan/xylan/chitin deacetylase (PgdA/CDA1 family)